MALIIEFLAKLVNPKR